MGSVLTIVCCSGSIGENNVEEEVEDKFTVGENVQNNDEAPHENACINSTTSIIS